MCLIDTTLLIALLTLKAPYVFFEECTDVMVKLLPEMMRTITYIS